MDRIQFQRPVSTQRTGQPAAALRRTLLVNLADAPTSLTRIEFDIGRGVSLSRGEACTSIQLFRRDDKDRIAAIDNGVPAKAIMPSLSSIRGLTGFPGTFDDQRLDRSAPEPRRLRARTGTS